MNVKFLTPFLEAVVDVLQAEVGVVANRGSLSLQKSALTTSEVTVLISIIGELQGVVLYGMSKETSLAIVSRIIGQTFDEFDSLAQSGIGELGNVISGKATVNLAKTGMETTISPPTLIVGKDAQISTLDFSRIVVPIDSEVGQIVVHLAVREMIEPNKSTSIGPLVASAKVNPMIVNSQ
jgi:chemotaxis protein CheX